MSNEPILGPGERWKIITGDCLEVMKGLPADSIPMIWTDPPFGHGNMDGDLQAARVRDGVKGARVSAAAPITNDAGVDFERVLVGFLDESARVLARDCCCCCCCCCGGGGPKPTFARVSNWIDERLAFFHAVVWDKSARGNGMGWRYRRNYEFVMVSHRKGGRLAWVDEQAAVPNVVRHAPPHDRLHPNEKPVNMIEDFIRWHTAPDDLILDPFSGVGSTGVAALRTGRRFIGIEIDDHYAEIARRRCAEAEQAFALFDPPAKEVQGTLLA